MNQLVNLSTASMSSMHISELAQSRHDKVKQSIERLVERGVVIEPPMGNEQSCATTVSYTHLTLPTKRIV